MTALLPLDKNYINGLWTKASSIQLFDVIQASSGEVIDQLSLSDETAVKEAVSAAKSAFQEYSLFSKNQKLDILSRLIVLYENSLSDMAQAISTEMGAPITMANNLQAKVGLRILQNTHATLNALPEMEHIGSARVYREPIGVAGMITPWNWPMTQVISKVAAALAAGCTMVLKPSEYAPYSTALLTHLIHQLDLPPGVFNMVFGGANAGAALAAHPDVDIISITGSTQAGIAVAKAAAPTVKRVTQELGGKSPFVILPDSDIQLAAGSCVQRLLLNSGQSCNAPTRLLVHVDSYDETLVEIKKAIANYKIGDPSEADTDVGPVVNAKQFERINELIQSGIDEGATLLCGGVSTIDSENPGYYVKPTVFIDVNENMRIVKEEIFGPVVCILPYHSLDEALVIANNTEYGLAAYIYANDLDKANGFAKNVKAGMIHINNAPGRMDTPFGGYKKSGNGRERGIYGIEEYLETKAVLFED